MLRKRPATALVAACAVGAWFAAPVSAADLTIASAPGAMVHTGDVPALVEKRRNKKDGAAKADRTRHSDQPRRIHAYKLYHDPFFKLSGAVADKRLLDSASSINGLGAGLGVMPTRAPANNIPATAFKADPVEGAGIAFNCRDRALNSTLARRGLVACYRNKLDNAWKAQTYVSGALSAGSPNWGGGLLLSYAY
jgi:hypothetical protein